MNDDRELNNILERRTIPAPSTNLSARIIDAAKINKQKSSLWQNILHEVMAMVILPRPAYALTLILFLGLILGLELDLTSNVNEVQYDEELFAFIDIDQEGGWL